MKALVAFDKFKDALTAQTVCDIAAKALSQVQPNWKIVTAPLADGGDGFCETLTNLANGEAHTVNVSGPLGQETNATYGIVDAANISNAAKAMLRISGAPQALAIIELAQSSGIALVPNSQRSPWSTSTYGLGQVIQHAVKNGANAILVGLGGSSSNDLGLAALQSLGFTFTTHSGGLMNEPPVPNRWSQIASITKPEKSFPVPVYIACDVENPLVGPNGAAAIFGPQKGLHPEDFESLDSQSKAIANLLCEACNRSPNILDTKGTGAAGGTAFGLMVGLGGKIISGAELVFAWSNLDEELATADIVLTGEGRFDNSSLQGKGPGSLALRATAAGKSTHVFAGSIGDFETSLPHDIFLTAISPNATSIDVAIANTEVNLRTAIQTTFRSYQR